MSSRREPFPEPSSFPFVDALARALAAIARELAALPDTAFVPSPDSLTTVADGYDETGWRWCPLFGTDPAAAANRERCPGTASAVAAIPGMQNAGFSLFLPGTHLYPHRGELAGVLRVHLPLLVPAGDVGIRASGELRRWQRGQCLVLDDTHEHEAWNHGDGPRVVLLVTFLDPPPSHRIPLDHAEPDPEPRRCQPPSTPA
jgi:ornithine lipid ester-linked acyl 2-hydroxylase